MMRVSVVDVLCEEKVHGQESVGSRPVASLAMTFSALETLETWTTFPRIHCSVAVHVTVENDIFILSIDCECVCV